MKQWFYCWTCKRYYKLEMVTCTEYRCHCGCPLISVLDISICNDLEREVR